MTAVAVLVVLGLAGCGSSAPKPKPAAPPAAAATTTSASVTAPAPVCHRVPRGTVRVIASHGNPKTRFAAGGAAAIHLRSGYAVSVVAIAGGSQRMATWFVDRLRGPHTVSSGNVAALQVTNWPLNALDAEPVRQSQICATERMRGPGPLAP
jgi:hypothetical protein